MPNTFSFSGDVFDGSGKKTGYGRIVTFGAKSTNWDASEANTLEDILTHTAVAKIRSDGKMFLAVPNSTRMGNNFNFKPNVHLPRFSIYIMDHIRDAEGKVVKVEAVGRIDFREVKVGPIDKTSQPKNITINGVEQRLETLAVDVVSCTVSRQSITPLKLKVVP